jgi:hypothetical protein
MTTSKEFLHHLTCRKKRKKDDGATITLNPSIDIAWPTLTFSVYFYLCVSHGFNTYMNIFEYWNNETNTNKEFMNTTYMVLSTCNLFSTSNTQKHTTCSATSTTEYDLRIFASNTRSFTGRANSSKNVSALSTMIKELFKKT